MSQGIKNIIRNNSDIWGIKVSGFNSQFGIFANAGVLVLDGEGLYLYLTLDRIKPDDSISSLLKEKKIGLLGGQNIIGNFMRIEVYDKNNSGVVDLANGLSDGSTTMTAEQIFDILNGKINIDLSDKADLAGDSNVVFRIAEGQQANDAVNLSQLNRINGIINNFPIYGNYFLKGFWNPTTGKYPKEDLAPSYAGWYWICSFDGNDPINERIWSEGDWCVYIGGNSAQPAGWMQIATVGNGVSTYSPQVPLGTKVPETHGGIVKNTTAEQLKGNTMSKMFDNILFPTVEAYVNPNKELKLTSNISAIYEVGTIVDYSLLSEFIRGTIINGDGSVNENKLIGIALSNGFKLFINDVFISANNIGSFTGQVTVSKGATRLNTSVEHGNGVGNYYNSKNEIGTNLNSQRVAGTLVSNVITISGRQKAFYGTGIIPTTPGEVRALSNNLMLSSSDTGTFNITIGAIFTKIAFAVPTGKNIKVYFVESSQADVTPTFTKSTMLINDAGIDTLLYDLYTTELATPYGVTSTYKVEIT